MTEENKNEEDWMEKRFREGVEGASWKETFYAEIVNQLQTEERYVNYFKQFRPESVDLFIKYYATTKVRWYEYAEQNKKWRQTKGVRWSKIAEEALRQIQCTKIELLRKKWDRNEYRPGEIHIHDFVEWLGDPLNFKEVSPVSKYEIQEYQNLFDDYWKKYDEDKAEDKRREEQGITGGVDKNGFDYYFIQRKSDDLSQLSGSWSEYQGKKNNISIYNVNTKGRQYIEGHYFYLAYQEEQKKKEEAKAAAAPIVQPVVTPPESSSAPVAAAPPVYDNREFLSMIHYKQYQYEKFIKTLDSKETLDNYRTMRKEYNSREFTEHIEMALIHLKSAKGYVAINSNDDWREAVYEANEMYSRKMVREAIADWWEVYIETIESGKVYKYLNERYPEKKNSDNKEKFVNYLIRGRELSGEPGDLNF